MGRCNTAVGLALAIGLVVWTPARAGAGQVLRYNFTATVDSSSSGLTPIGTIVTGTLSFDLDAPGTVHTDASGSYADYGTGQIAFTGGGLSYASNPSSYHLTRAFDDYGDPTIDGLLIGARTPSEFAEIYLWAFNRPTVMASSALPGALAPLASYDYATLRWGRQSGSEEFTATITALSAVPEPCTLISGFVAAMAGLGLAWRRRRIGAA